MSKSKFTRLIEDKLIKSKPKILGKFTPEHYISGNAAVSISGNEKEKSSLTFTNHNMPSLRNLLKEDFLVSKKNSKADLYNEFRNLWLESNYFEAKMIALYWLDYQSIDFLIDNSKDILSWAELIDNWAHSDTLCNIYSRLYENDQKRTLSQYQKWNSARESWLRRCSMVGTFYYSRLRKIQPEYNVVKRLVSPHLSAPEYYVQKGVGWTIREMYNVYPDKTSSFIAKNIKKITPIAWVAASEKLPKKEKNLLLLERKNQ